MQTPQKESVNPLNIEENLYAENKIRTFTGKYVNPFNMTEDDICIEDIAHSLSNTARFGGHLPEWYSVAQHCINASIMAPDGMELMMLLHDASEAYLMDIPSPLKKQMPEYIEAEARLQALIYSKFRCVPSSITEPILKSIDKQLLEKEWHQLFVKDEKNKMGLMNQELAETYFLSRFHRFYSEDGVIRNTNSSGTRMNDAMNYYLQNLSKKPDIPSMHIDEIATKSGITKDDAKEFTINRKDEVRAGRISCPQIIFICGLASEESKMKLAQLIQPDASVHYYSAVGLRLDNSENIVVRGVSYSFMIDEIIEIANKDKDKNFIVFTNLEMYAYAAKNGYDKYSFINAKFYERIHNWQQKFINYIITNKNYSIPTGIVSFDLR